LNKEFAPRWCDTLPKRFPVVWQGGVERGKGVFMSKIVSKSTLAAGVSLAMALTFSQQEASLC